MCVDHWHQQRSLIRKPHYRQRARSTRTRAAPPFSRRNPELSLDMLVTMTLDTGLFGLLPEARNTSHALVAVRCSLRKIVHFCQEMESERGDLYRLELRNLLLAYAMTIGLANVDSDCTLRDQLPQSGAARSTKEGRRVTRDSDFIVWRGYEWRSSLRAWRYAWLCWHRSDRVEVTLSAIPGES